MEDRQACNEAIRHLNGALFMGSTLRVEFARNDTDRRFGSVIKGTCYKCGGVGHYLRECPSQDTLRPFIRPEYREEATVSTTTGDRYVPEYRNGLVSRLPVERYHHRYERSMEPVNTPIHYNDRYSRNNMVDVREPYPPRDFERYGSAPRPYSANVKNDRLAVDYRRHETIPMDRPSYRDPMPSREGNFRGRMNMREQRVVHSSRDIRYRAPSSERYENRPFRTPNTRYREERLPMPPGPQLRRRSRSPSGLRGPRTPSPRR
ncbi:hypothetical protein BDF14DRAFT_1101728 [Spinellus fusiger]|nr:hypothetical protein BDF14DRAFT_1101728 [Spinellus fusiger]